HTYAGNPPIEALRGINLRIFPGEYVAIIGANGSGKSTLARHLNALLLPGRGRVLAAGIDTQDTDQRSAIRRVVQMVFQQPDSQIVATTVEEDVAFGPENFGIRDGDARPRAVCTGDGGNVGAAQTPAAPLIGGSEAARGDCGSAGAQAAGARIR
ncbi:MAG TPA: ATP-binding cassette domain-containing protein, partial [Anaerolineales bacterium]|nr:ATP-binding cassette domain-containing protein [Anaerolineales bacterium]